MLLASGWPDCFLLVLPRLPDTSLLVCLEDTAIVCLSLQSEVSSSEQEFGSTQRSNLLQATKKLKFFFVACFLILLHRFRKLCEVQHECSRLRKTFEISFVLISYSLLINGGVVVVVFVV